ncbi:MAG: cation transporter [Candidatus Nitrosotenuis sp.]|nr:MAG: cation transporter [Candidatus Nitrosotenuis sp.]
MIYLHNHTGNHVEKRLWLVFVISVSVFLLEIIGGVLSNSLALISDSFHVMLDFTAIGISLIAFRIAKKAPSPKLSFGFHRAEIVAALINGITLILVSVFIFYESYKRFLEPQAVQTDTLLVFAVAGFAANIAMMVLLKKDSHSNLNIKGSYTHVFGDMLSSIGVIAGAIIMIFTDYPIIDPIVSVGIGILIVRSGIMLCKECTHIFMEGAPREIKMESVSEEIEGLEEVSEVHDLHIWTLTSNVFAMSAHVKIKQEYVPQTNNLLRKINEVLKEKFGINHCTVQIEHDLINPDKK